MGRFDWFLVHVVCDYFLSLLCHSCLNLLVLWMTVSCRRFSCFPLCVEPPFVFFWRILLLSHLIAAHATTSLLSQLHVSLALTVTFPFDSFSIAFVLISWTSVIPLMVVFCSLVYL